MAETVDEPNNGYDLQLHQFGSVPMTKSTVLLLVVTTFVVAVINAAFLFYMVLTTSNGDVRGRLALSEQILLNSITIPDMVFVIYTLFLVLPMTYKNKWEYGMTTTTWFGFIHIVSILHPSMAIGCVCNLIALNYTEENRYETVNKEGNMTILCLAYLGITVCFCSLSAVETGGLIYNPYWFSPLLTVYEGIGGILTVSVLTTISVMHQVFSLKDLLMTQGHYSNAKMDKREMANLRSHINFVGLNITITVVTALAISSPVNKMENHVFALIFRMFVFVMPICRIILLTKSCPHFEFVLNEDDDNEMTAFAELGATKRKKQ